MIQRFFYHVSCFWLRMFAFNRWLQTEQACTMLAENDKLSRAEGRRWLRMYIKMPLIAMLKLGVISFNKPVILNTRESKRYNHDICYAKDMDSLIRFVEEHEDIGKMDIVEVSYQQTYYDVFLIEPDPSED